MTIPVTEDSSGSRIGLSSAIGLVAATLVGDTIIGECRHIALLSRVIVMETSCQRAIGSIAIRMEGGVNCVVKMKTRDSNAPNFTSLDQGCFSVHIVLFGLKASLCKLTFSAMRA